MKPLLLHLSLASMALLGATNAISAPEFTLESQILLPKNLFDHFNTGINLAARETAHGQP